jgi:hypothetical protein
LALDIEDAGGEGVGRVGGQDGAFHLQDDWACVVVGIGEVDGAASFFFACGEDSLVDVMAVHAFAAEFWEKGGVDVDDFVFVAGRDADHFEVAGEDDEVEVVFVERRAECIGGDGAWDGEDVEAAVFAALNAGAGAAGDDEGDAGGEVIALDGVEKVEDGAAAAGDHAAEVGEVGKGVFHLERGGGWWLIRTFAEPQVRRRLLADGGGAAEGDGGAGFVDRDEDDLGAGHGDAVAGGEAFGFDFDGDGDGFGAFADGGGVEIDDVAQVDGGFEVDAVERGGDPAVGSVFASLDKAGLVDVGEDDAAEDGAVVVGVARESGDAEGEGAGQGGG